MLWCFVILFQCSSCWVLSVEISSFSEWNECVYLFFILLRQCSKLVDVLHCFFRTATNIAHSKMYTETLIHCINRWDNCSFFSSASLDQYMLNNETRGYCVFPILSWTWTAKECLNKQMSEWVFFLSADELLQCNNCSWKCKKSRRN